VHRINQDGTLRTRDPAAPARHRQIRPPDPATPDTSNDHDHAAATTRPDDNPVNPGSLKVYNFSSGVLSTAAGSSLATAHEVRRATSTSIPIHPWVYVFDREPE